VVTGLGLIGLLTVQLLRAQGVQVLGIDVDQHRLDLAASMGAQVVMAGEGVIRAAEHFSSGRGVDGVLITASTKSSEPVQGSPDVSPKGRIVLVGVTGMELDRADFYEKELSFQVSCSYGPGRYDPSYEDRGVDYPLGHGALDGGPQLRGGARPDGGRRLGPVGPADPRARPGRRRRGLQRAGGRSHRPGHRAPLPG